MYFCMWLANLIAKIWGEVKFYATNFDSTANTACYVCCKFILTFVQFL